MVEIMDAATGKPDPFRKKKEKKTSGSSCGNSLDKSRLQDILENIPSAVVVFEPNGKVIYANKRAIELHGKDPCGIPIEKQSSDLKIYSITGELCPTEELHIYKAIFHGETFRDAPIILERTDGERFLVNVNAKPLYNADGKAIGAIAIFDDVTERMQTQEALMDSEERLNMAQRIAHMGSWEYIIKEDQAVWSEELFRIFGLTPQKFGPNIKNYLALIHPDDRPMMEKHMLSGRLTGSESFDYRIVLPSRTVRTIHTERIVRQRDEQGRPSRIMGVEQDITERKQTENTLKESEERLKMAQQIAHMGSWEYHVKEDKALWSDELFRIFGLPIQKYGPNIKEYFSIIHPDSMEAINKAMALQTTGHLYSKASFDYHIQRPDGTVRAIHSERMISEVDEEEKAKVIAGIEQDITERKQIEQKLEEYAKNLERLVEERTRQLKDAERLAAIGQTAGMIGHDIRNPLQAIAGDLYLITEDVEASPDTECKRSVKESLVEIQEQIDYMNKIIADLQDYARPLKPEQVEVDLCIVIPQLVATVKIPQNVVSVTECDRALPRIKIDRTFLKRVLVNLTMNAVQAMPNGGKLTIKATAKGGNAVITVADTGTGIPEEFKPKIFQPLMTTKSKGQGFGLAVVKRLVEAQGGTISFESKAGAGTTFTLTFPNK
ncbi:PAS domain S-box protein [Candidatus Bathyarchaeota archaeon]|nr:PAS domain S-box protein [Candidatus Bathyarchaeota archaeon]